MCTHNIDFYEDLTKIIFELSSNTHLISSAALSSQTEVINLLISLHLNSNQHTRLYKIR